MRPPFSTNHSEAPLAYHVTPLDQSDFPPQNEANFPLWAYITTVGISVEDTNEITTITQFGITKFHYTNVGIS